MFKVLICGSRDFNDYKLINSFVQSLPDETVLIEGEARGADSIARDAAIKRGLRVEKFPADWQKYGKKAGILRNYDMLQEGKPNIVVAYSTDIKNSKGTKNMLEQSIKVDIPAYLNLSNYNFIDLEGEVSLEDL